MKRFMYEYQYSWFDEEVEPQNRMRSKVIYTSPIYNSGRRTKFKRRHK